MSLVTIFLAMFLLLGILTGPLILAFAIRAYSPKTSKRLAAFAFKTANKSVYRPAFTFNAANELTLKRRAYDEQHDEQKIVYGGALNKIERYIFDPQNRIHHWAGVPFTIIEERFGIAIDPRDVTLGAQLDRHQTNGTYTQTKRLNENRKEAVLGVFTLPANGVGVNLTDVWSLIGGSFDSQLVRKIHEYYQKSQAPKAETSALRQLLVPVGTFIAVILLGLFAAGQMAGGGGTPPKSGTNSSIKIGATLLLAATTRLNRRDAAVTLIGLAVAASATIGLITVFGVPVPLLGTTLPLGAWGLIAFATGLPAIPFIASWFGRSLGPIGVLLGTLFHVIGLLGYTRPVLALTGPRTYRVVEYSDHDWSVEPSFYRYAMTRLGVGFLNSDQVWHPDVLMHPEELRTINDTATDGTKVSPPGYRDTDAIAQGAITGYIPSDIDDDALYVRTDFTTGWFSEAGQNRRLMQAALESAKEKYGGGIKPVGDKYILTATLAAMVLGAVFDWVVFFR